jgi:hypothetical protein
MEWAKAQNFAVEPQEKKLYFTLILSLNMPLVSNSVTSNDENKMELTQQKFAAFCFNCLFPSVHYCYASEH